MPGCGFESHLGIIICCCGWHHWLNLCDFKVAGCGEPKLVCWNVLWTFLGFPSFQLCLQMAQNEGFIFTFMHPSLLLRIWNYHQVIRRIDHCSPEALVRWFEWCQSNTPVYALARSFNIKVKGASNGIGSCGGLMVEYSPSEVEDSVYHTRRPQKSF